MNRWTVVMLLAVAVGLAGCGGGGSSGSGRPESIVSLAQTMITEATSDDCPTTAHCVPWPVESLATVTTPDDADALDL